MIQSSIQKSKTARKLEKRCRKALYEFKLVEGVTKVAVALSGGKDSLTLLYLLKEISGRGFDEFEIHAIHVSGEFSCGAGIHTSFLYEICDQLGVNLVVKESTQKLETLECYSCSRERRKLLFDAAKELGIQTIAFGHHRDDFNQTLLMNLFHKAEFSTNHPKIQMKSFGVTIIRPLVFIEESDIRTFAEQNQFARIMCRCPVGQNSLRKKTEEVITELEHTYPNVRHNLFLAGLKYGSNKALNP